MSDATKLPLINDYIDWHYSTGASKKMHQVLRGSVPASHYQPNAVDEKGVPVYVARPVIEINTIREGPPEHGNRLTSWGD